LSQETNVATSTVYKALSEKFKLYPYRISAVHELKPTDNAKRLQYCDWFHTFLQQKGEDVLEITFYTEEAWFRLSGFVNSQNSLLWYSENPHALHESPLHAQMISVWIAISRWRNVGPIFFHQTMNSERYCSEILFPFVAPLDEDEIHNATFNRTAQQHTQPVIP
jgi:hypothetical protein